MGLAEIRTQDSHVTGGLANAQGKQAAIAIRKGISRPAHSARANHGSKQIRRVAAGPAVVRHVDAGRGTRSEYPSEPEVGGNALTRT